LKQGENDDVEEEWNDIIWRGREISTVFGGVVFETAYSNNEA
jgi:hypothetical protein